MSCCGVRTGRATLIRHRRQQAAVIRRVVRDLNLPVRIDVPHGPRARRPGDVEPQRLSRRRRAPPRRRAQARARCRRAARRRRRARRRRNRAAGRAAGRAGVEPEYLGRRPDTFTPVRDRRPGRLVAVAARVGGPTHRQHTIHANGRRRIAMQRTMLKSKIHRATVTDATCTTSARSRSTPTARRRRHPRARAGARRRHRQRRALRDLHHRRRARLGEMKVNGAAARLVHHGDTIIVISYAHYDRPS